MNQTLPTILEEALHAMWQVPQRVVAYADDLWKNPDKYKEGPSGGPHPGLSSEYRLLPTLGATEDNRICCRFVAKPGERPAFILFDDEAEDRKEYHPCWANPQPWWEASTEQKPEVSLASRYVWNLSDTDPNTFRTNWLVLDVIPYEVDETIHDLTYVATEMLKNYNSGGDYRDGIGNIHAALESGGFGIDEIVAEHKRKYATRDKLKELLDECGLPRYEIQQRYPHSTEYTVCLPRDTQTLVAVAARLPSFVGEAEIKYVFEEHASERRSTLHH